MGALERAQEFAQRHNIERAHGSYSDLLMDDEIDIVYVSGLNHQHHAAVMRALQMGKHVLCK